MKKSVDFHFKMTAEKKYGEADDHDPSAEDVETIKKVSVAASLQV